MALFNKTVYCPRCGKPFEKGVLSSDKFCYDCQFIDLKQNMLNRSIEEQQQGIKNYYDSMPKRFRGMPADINTIIASRNNMLNNYRRDTPMNIDMLDNARKNFVNWNDEQMVRFSCWILNALISTQNRSSFVLGDFLISHLYDGVAVSFDSVFAIALEENYLLKVPAGEQAYLCHLFTNDPYFPVAAISFTPRAESKGIFAEAQRKQEREATLHSILPKLFTNLTYPVMSCKELAAVITQEGRVRGNLSPEFVFTLLKEKLNMPFWAVDMFMPEAIPFGISYAMQDFGYITYDQVNSFLFVEDRQVTDYWLPYFIRAEQEISQLKEQLSMLYNASPGFFGGQQQ